MGQDEQQRVMAPRDQEPPELEEGGAAAVSCDYCGGARAVVYCRADTASLCLPCDRHVHGANTVCSRHARAPLCAACRAAGAVFRRGAGGGGAAAAEFLCSNCDFGRHRDGAAPGAPLHDRCTVQGYTGCPSAHELAALLGVAAEFDKPASAGAAADEGWWNIWEEPQVLSLEDIIVPTTSCHGFQPLVTPPSPKSSPSPDGKTNEEIIKQLGELAESDCGAQTAAHEQAGDQFPSWSPSEYITGHDNFGAEKNCQEIATMPTPGCENGKWNNTDHHALNEGCKAEFAYEQAPVSSAEPCLSSFVQMSQICPSMSNGSSMEDNHQANPGNGMPMQALPKKGGLDIVPCPDRGSVISRYKEKRRTRRFDKQVRYESRKVRADGRLRIKGRFAKASQI